MEEDHMEKRLSFTIREAARLLGVSEVTLYRSVEAGTLPCRRIQSRILIPREVLENFGKAPVPQGTPQAVEA